MLFTGENYRSLQERENYSFFFNGNVDNVTGSALFGFSGTGVGGSNEIIKFDFKEGRITDPEGRYTYSYLPSGDFEISGNVNKSNYDYFINKERVVESGVKNDFVIDRFFMETTGCALNSLSTIITVTGEGGFSLSGFDSEQGLGINQSIEGTVSHDGSGETFKIFSGEILDTALKDMFVYSNYPTVSTSTNGTLELSGISGIEENVRYDIGTRFHTSFGRAIKYTSITGNDPHSQVVFYTQFLDSEVANDFVISGGTGIVSGGLSAVEKTGLFTVNHTYYTGGVSYETGLPINVSLMHESGFTGTITGTITGIDVINSGSNYYDYGPYHIPSVVASGGGGAGAVLSGVIATDVDFEGLFKEVVILDGGQDYTSIPEIVIYSGVYGVEMPFDETIGVSGGSGYISEPVVTFSTLELQGGDPATAKARINSLGFGSVRSIDLTFGATGYWTKPDVVFLPGLFSGSAELTHSGSGYNSVPSVVIEGDGSGAYVTALTGVIDSVGYVTGFNTVSGGSGYSSVPNLVVSGGTPDVSGSGVVKLATGAVANAIMQSDAKATGFIANLTKQFTGQWNLFTGSGGHLFDFRDNGQIDDINVGYTGANIYFVEDETQPAGVQESINIQVTNVNYYDNKPLVAKLTISGSGSNIDTYLITGVK